MYSPASGPAVCTKGCPKHDHQLPGRLTSYRLKGVSIGVYVGIMEKKRETTIMGSMGFGGIRVI